MRQVDHKSRTLVVIHIFHTIDYHQKERHSNLLKTCHSVIGALVLSAVTPFSPESIGKEITFIVSTMNKERRLFTCSERQSGSFRDCQQVYYTVFNLLKQ